MSDFDRVRTCQVCGKQLKRRMRRDRAFCSSDCKWIAWQRGDR